MYEKYSGLPDTQKSRSTNGKRPAERSSSRPGSSSGGQIEYYQAPNRNGEATSAKRANKRRAKARKRKLILAGMSLAFLALIVVAVVVLTALAVSTLLAPDTARMRDRKGGVNDCQRDLLRPYGSLGWRVRAVRSRMKRW